MPKEERGYRFPDSLLIFNEQKKIIVMKAILAGIILCMLSVTSFLFISSSGADGGQNVWSKPEELYMYPSESIGAAREFQANVHEETIHIVGGYRHLREFRYLEDSKIFYLRQNGDAQPEVQLLSTNNYPSEQPSLLLNQSGVVHFLWGDRRLDPDFEVWKTERPQGLGFSTNVIYSKYNGSRFTTTESIYEGHLREQAGGIGDISLPVQWDEDSQGQLHAVFAADTTLTVPTPDGEEIYENVSHVTYMNHNSSDGWSEPQFLMPGVDPAIVTLPESRLMVTFLGDAFINQPGFHNVQVITSDDGGKSWSDPQTVFLSGQQPGRQLGLKTGSDGTIHLVWGRQTRGLPIPNELWHSYSDDGGNSWSQPERFFQPEQAAQNENLIDSFDLIIDRSGRLHCAAVVVNLQQSNGTLFCVMWDPETESWEPEEVPQLPEAPRNNVDLALDGTNGKMYLFWDEAEEDAIYYSVMEPTGSPVIAQSGPLQLHANYPNPFNPSTRISFTLEESAEVVLTVFDISGRQIMQRNLGAKPAGLHSEQISLEGLTSGTYIYEVELNNTWRQQSTMMLIK